MDGLTEGRIVHYVAYNGRHLAAIVIGGDFQSGSVNLAVFSDMPNVRGGVNLGLTFQASVPKADPDVPGTWHWPEREPDVQRAEHERSEFQLKISDEDLAELERRGLVQRHPIVSDETLLEAVAELGRRGLVLLTQAEVEQLRSPSHADGT